MRLAVRSSALLLALAVAARTADSDADEIYRKTRAIVVDNVRRLPRYTCVETISRAQYAPVVYAPTCQAQIESQRLLRKRGALVERDKLRLDVAAADDGEIFSWAGARKFEAHDVAGVVGNGATSSGDFGAFLGSVFGGAPDAIRLLGISNGLALFEYNVPRDKSGYRFRANGSARNRAFNGSFDVDPATGALKQMTVETEDFDRNDNVCRIQHTMKYAPVKISDSDFLLPEVTTLEGLYRDGSIALNETHYSACRAYVGESTISFGDAEPAGGQAAAESASRPLPPNVRVAIGLSKPIDTATAAAGDPVEGILLQNAVDKQAVVAKANARVYGRILRLELDLDSPPRWTVGLRFDTIVRDGIEQAISLNPLDDGVRSAQRLKLRPNGAVADKPQGSGLFIFPGSVDFVLDQKFHSEWQTR